MNLDTIQEELFCLKFENKALADIYFRNEAERWVYSYMYDNTEKEHLDRYNFVKPIVEGKKVSVDSTLGPPASMFSIALTSANVEQLALASAFIKEELAKYLPCVCQTHHLQADRQPI